MKPQRLALFDTLKGVAILMVCITHFAWERQERIDLLFPFWISMAVPIFMIVTGYLTAASYERKQYGLRQLYSAEALLPKLAQYLRPFTLMFLAELVLELLCKGSLPSLRETVRCYLEGGIGKYGTYYVPVLLQMLVLFPLIYAVIRKNRHGVWLCFAVNLLYELNKDALGIDSHDSRLLAFRYIFLISMGCYLYFDRQQLHLGKYALLLAVGVGYIHLISYTAYKPVIFTRWNATSMMTAFYIAPIIALLLKDAPQLRLPPFTALGRASYHIFLAQILYYNYFRHALPVENRMARMVLGVGLCLLSGLLFHALDRKLPSLRRILRPDTSISA